MDEVWWQRLIDYFAPLHGIGMKEAYHDEDLVQHVPSW